MNGQTTAIKRHLGQVFAKSLNLSHPLCQLQTIREKLETRGLQDFDRQDILGGLGSLQHRLGELHCEMLKIHDLLKQP